MKKILTLIICLSSTSLFAQFGVSYHQSGQSFVGFNYEIADRFLPELRFSMDNPHSHMAVEAVATYQFLNKNEYEVYAGIGGRVNNREGIVAPIGVHVFPFAAKNFGFHMEVAPILHSRHPEDHPHDNPYIRGSWGIRYRFRR